MHSRYEQTEEYRAKKDVEQLENDAHIDAVCMMRETYNENTNENRDSVVYHSPWIKRPSRNALHTKDTVNTNISRKGRKKAGILAARSRVAANQIVMRSSANPDDVPVGSLPQFDDDYSEPSSSGSKLVVSGLISLLCALLVAYLCFEVLRAVHEIGISVDSDTGKIVLVAIFCLVFAVVFYPLVKRKVGLAQEDHERRDDFEMPIQQATANDEAATDPTSIEETEEEKLARYDAAHAAIRKAHHLSEGEDFTEMSLQSLLERKAELEAEDAKPEPAVELPAVKKTRDSVTRYIGSALAPVVSTPATMDAYTRFGITLYVAGAAEYAGSTNGLSSVQRKSLLAEQIQLLGHKPEIAAGFSQNIDEYLTNSKYLGMYDRGRSAMAAQLDDPEEAPTLAEALGEWNKPSGQQGQADSAIVVVMFTDIVNSTAMGQERGDESAMTTLRAHDRIVRDALSAFDGEEVKHTGDGIMAIFPIVANAMEAATEILVSVSNFAEQNSESAFQIRIGVNAGEPIQEGGDYFGTPVQLAARIMDYAGPNEVAASQVVRDLMQGKSFAFEKIDDFELKGFKEPVPVYRLAR